MQAFEQCWNLICKYDGTYRSYYDDLLIIITDESEEQEIYHIIVLFLFDDNYIYILPSYHLYEYTKNSAESVYHQKMWLPLRCFIYR
jgi:hypothetical protein